MKCGIHSVKSKNALDDLAWGEMTIVRHLRNEKAVGAEMRSTIDLFNQSINQSINFIQTR